MKHLLITAAIALLASAAMPASAQATKTRKMQDTQQRGMQDTMNRRTAPARPMGMDSTNKYPHDSIPNKNINGR